MRRFFSVLQQVVPFTMPLLMAQEGDKEYVSLEEWERCLKTVSYCMLRIGPALAPLLERVEREVERARREDPMVRARMHLEGFAEQLGHRAKSLQKPVALLATVREKVSHAER